MRTIQHKPSGMDIAFMLFQALFPAGRYANDKRQKKIRTEIVFWNLLSRAGLEAQQGAQDVALQLEVPGFTLERFAVCALWVLYFEPSVHMGLLLAPKIRMQVDWLQLITQSFEWLCECARWLSVDWHPI